MKYIALKKYIILYQTKSNKVSLGVYSTEQSFKIVWKLLSLKKISLIT